MVVRGPFGYVGEVGPDCFCGDVFDYYFVCYEVVCCAWEVFLRPVYGALGWVGHCCDGDVVEKAAREALVQF